MSEEPLTYQFVDGCALVFKSDTHYSVYRLDVADAPMTPRDRAIAIALLRHALEQLTEADV